MRFEVLDEKELLKGLDMKEILELDRKEPKKEMDVAVSGGEQKLTNPGANRSKKRDEGCLEEFDKKELMKGFDMKGILELHKKQSMKEMDIAVSGGEQKITNQGANHSKKRVCCMP